MITVIVPIHNTGKYVEECLDSILRQSYRDIEVLCIDSSTDHTKDILDEYVKKDSRIRYIYDENGSYGYKLNVGIAQARGKWIAIVDSDDYVEPMMLQRLLDVAEENRVDFVKSDYTEFVVENERNVLGIVAGASAIPELYGKVFDCKEYPELIYRNAVAIWTGLYRRDFLKELDIRLHESPGASFQDTGFCIMTHVLADRIYYLKESYYRYRTDNAASSVKSDQKDTVIADEMRWVDAEMKRQEISDMDLIKAVAIKKLIAYEWNYSRLKRKSALRFADYIHEELKERYVDTGLADELPTDIKEKFDRMYSARERMQKEHKELEEILGKIAEENAGKSENILEKQTAEEDMPVVSVVVPVYNVEPYLKECLLSILTQSFGDMEVICVDDGSTDGSPDVLEEFVSLDPRITVVSQENKGQAAARNAGIRRAKGKYLLFVDGDDTILTDTLKELVDLAKKYQTNIVSFDAECNFMPGVSYDAEKVKYYHRMQGYGLLTGKEMFARMFLRERFTDSACLMLLDREWFMETGITFREGILYEDSIFSVTLFMEAERIYHTNQQYYIYRIREKSTMTSDRHRARNLYGRVVCLKELMRLQRQESFTDYQEEAFIKWTLAIRWAVGDIASHMPEQEWDRFWRIPDAKDYKLEVALGDAGWEASMQRYEADMFMEQIDRAKEVEIYGAGVRGKRLLEYFYLSDEAVRVKNFIVTKKGNMTDAIRGIPVRSMEEGYCPSEDSLIVISFRGNDAEQVKYSLQEKGVENVVILTDVFNGRIRAETERLL